MRPLDRGFALVLVLTSAVVVPLAMAKSKGEARDELKAKHFIAYDNGAQFNKAFLEKNLEIVKLFFEAHNGFPDLEPAISFNDKFPPTEEDAPSITKYLNHAIEMGSLDMLKLFVEIEKLNSSNKAQAIHTAIMAGVQLQNCNPDLVTYLYSKEIRLEDGHTDENKGSEDLAKVVAAANCDAMLAVLLKAHPKSAPVAMTAFTEQNKRDYNKDHSASAPFWTADFQKRFTASEKVLKDANARLCKPEDGLDACRALKEHEEFEKLYAQGKLDQKSSADQAQREEAYRKTPEYHQLTACSLLKQKKEGEAEIARQKKIASVSGVKDEKALYAAGETIAKAEAAIAEHTAEFKKLTKKALDLKKCK